MCTKYIFGIITCIGLLISACSKNLDDKMEAVSVEKYINVFINESIATGLNLTASASSTPIEIKSNLKWEVSVDSCEGDWCKVDVSDGRGSGTFNIEVGENGLHTRECIVRISSIGYIQSVKAEIHVVQQRVSEELAQPLVEIPYLKTEPKQSSASIQFSYSSPYYAITGYGIEYRKDNEEDWIQTSGSLVNNIVTVDLIDLAYGTTYIARGYVEYDVDNSIKIQYSSAPLIFITAGETPGNSDNPPPPSPY